MKCPYQKVVVHQPKYTEGNTTYFAKDTVVFGECVESNCPYYYKTEYKPARIITEHCRRVESELKK